MKFKSLIGSRIEWTDRRSLLNRVQSGVIQQVAGNNVMIDGDWKWGPDLRAMGAHVIPHLALPTATQPDA